MKADHNTITAFGVKIMSKYKVLSKRESGVIKRYPILGSDYMEKRRPIRYLNSKKKVSIRSEMAENEEKNV